MTDVPTSNQQFAADISPQAVKTSDDLWINFEDHFYHGCCDCGSSHYVHVSRRGEGHAIKWQHYPELTDETRKSGRHPLWDELVRLRSMQPDETTPEFVVFNFKKDQRVRFIEKHLDHAEWIVNRVDSDWVYLYMAEDRCYTHFAKADQLRAVEPPATLLRGLEQAKTGQFVPDPRDAVKATTPLTLDPLTTLHVTSSGQITRTVRDIIEAGRLPNRESLK